MTIPDYQSLMLPLLKHLADRQEHSLRETIEALADEFHLTENERTKLLPSGQQSTFDNRVGWARTYMKKAGLLESPRRGFFRITDRGVEVLCAKPREMNAAFLRHFPEFVAFQKLHREKADTRTEPVVDDTQTPEEEIEAAYQRVRAGLAEDLLQMVKNCSPAFFERLIIDLLVKMGYGGTRKDAGQAIGRSGDGGIDGIINEDRLGLDIVYVQAKRWDSMVGSPEIHKFIGALSGKHAKKGIFVTTSDFSKPARDYISVIDSKVVLIDGDTLAQLMIDFNIGVTPIAAYELKRVDSDYFAEE